MAKQFHVDGTKDITLTVKAIDIIVAMEALKCYKSTLHSIAGFNGSYSEETQKVLDTIDHAGSAFSNELVKEAK